MAGFDPSMIPGGAQRQIANASGNPAAVGIDPRAFQPQPPQQQSPVSNLPAQWQNAPQQPPEPEEEPAPKSKLEIFREKYPIYDNMPDEELVYRLYDKYYRDKAPTIEQFYIDIGYTSKEDLTFRDKGRFTAQGATVGFGDELTAGLAAGIAKLATLAPGEQAGEDSSFGDIYRDIVQTERDQLESARKDNPIESLAYEVGGGIATGGVGALRTVGTTLATKTGIGAAWGGAYGAGAADPDVDAPTLENLKERAIGGAKGAAIGAVAAPALTGAGILASTGYGKIKNIKLERRLKTQEGRENFSKEYNDELALNIAMGDTRNEAIKRANKKFGTTTDRAFDLQYEVGAKRFDALHLSKEQAMDKVAADGLLRKTRLQGGVMKNWDKIVEPIYFRIEKHSPRIAQNLRNFESKVYSDVHQWHEELKPYINITRKLKGTDKERYAIAMYNGEFATARQLLINSSKGTPDEIGTLFDNATVLIKNIGQKMKDEGAGFDDAANYYPRRIKKIEELKERLGSKYLEGFEAYANALRNKGGGREQNALNAYMRGNIGKKIKETSRRSRKVRAVDEELIKYYEDPVASLDLFLREAASSIRRRQLFAGHVKENANGVELVDKSIDSLMGTFGNLTPAAKNEIADLLKVRFNEGEKGMTPMWSNLRAIAHNSLLGDAVSAATQLGDIGVSAWINGSGPTIQALSRALIGKNRITADDLGIMREMVAEISDPGSMQRTTDWIFRNSGLKLLPSFRSVDRLGKNVAINSTLTKYTKIASSYAGKKQLTKDLAPAWGDETAKLVDELSRGEITDLTKQFLFSKLSDMQPISRSEMPEKFLKMQDGRILYQLSSWTMKQLALYRNRAYNKIRDGNAKEKAEGLKDTIRMIAVVGGMNIASDETKRVILNKDSAFKDGMGGEEFAVKLLSNVVKNFTGISEGRDTLGKIGSASAPVGSIAGRVIGASGLYPGGNGAFQEVVETGSLSGEKVEKFGRTVTKTIPLVGRIVESWLMGGAEEFNKKQKAEKDAAKYKHLGL